MNLKSVMIKPFSTFYIDSYSFDKATLTATFRYNFDNEVFFEEKVDYSSGEFTVQNHDAEVIHSILFHISIFSWISYYKLYPTAEIVVNTWALDEDQKAFRKKQYQLWLGEFFYKNNMSPKWLCNFVNGVATKVIRSDFKTSDRALVPVGGGKDSIVSIELLRKQNIDIDLFTFGKDNPLYQATQNISWNKRLIIKKEMSKNLFDMNQQGYYNGHVPITGIIAFHMLLVAYLYDYKYLVLSNEKSADQWNTIWEWMEVNHQYSKSVAFENDFRAYVKQYITSHVEYFSLLRWLYEVHIAKRFSNYPQYFPVFSSCNNNFKIQQQNKITQNRWCNQCPKCAFVFTILRPYISQQDVETIWWEDLYENPQLLDLFKELLWISNIKPFECVWTAEEMLYSMYKALDKYSTLPFILAEFEFFIREEIARLDLESIEQRLFSLYNDNVPLSLSTFIK